MSTTPPTLDHRVGLARLYVAKLALLLRHHLQEGDFGKASAVLSVLAKRTTSVPELVWKVSLLRLFYIYSIAHTFTYNVDVFFFTLSLSLSL